MDQAHLKYAGIGKRFLAYFLDSAMVVIVAAILYTFVTSNFMLKANGGYGARSEMFSYAIDSGLFDASSSDGDYITNMSLHLYSAAPSDTQSQPGYALYCQEVKDYYTVFLPSDPRVDPITTTSSDGSSSSIAPKDYYTMAHFDTAILGLPEPSSITDFTQETNYSSTYFEYVLTTDKTAVDLTQAPVLTSKYQKLVADSDTEALTALNNYFYNQSAASGKYYEAAAHLEGQSYYVNLSNDYSLLLWECLLVAYLPLHFVFFIVIPLCFKNGETLGKKILGLAIIGKDGYAVKPLPKALHLGSVFLLGLFPIFYWVVIGIMIYILGAIVDYMVLVMSKDHSSLHDKLAKTIVIDAKGSVWFASPEAEELYAQTHPGTFFKEQTPEQKAENERIAAEDAILDLSTMNKNRDAAKTMSSFDDYEKDAKKEESAPEKPAEAPQVETKPAEPVAPNEEGFTDDKKD
jgi:uncharacterized RDD family membrane protein YckC